MELKIFLQNPNGCEESSKAYGKLYKFLNGKGFKTLNKCKVWDKHIKEMEGLILSIDLDSVNNLD